MGLVCHRMKAHFCYDQRTILAAICLHVLRSVTSADDVVKPVHVNRAPRIRAIAPSWIDLAGPDRIAVVQRHQALAQCVQCGLSAAAKVEFG
jgi:hypothetical protein